MTNVASFVDKQAVTLEVAALGTLTADTAYGGDSFVIVDAADLGLFLSSSEASISPATTSWIRCMCIFARLRPHNIDVFPLSGKYGTNLRFDLPAI